MCVLGWSLFPAWLQQLEKCVIHSGFWWLSTGDRHSSTLESACFSLSTQRERNGGSPSATQLGGLFSFPFDVEALWSSLSREGLQTRCLSLPNPSSIILHALCPLSTGMRLHGFRFKAVEGWPEAATTGCLLVGHCKAAAISRCVWLRFAVGQIPAASFQAGSVQLQGVLLCGPAVKWEMLTTHLLQQQNTRSPGFHPDPGCAGTQELLLCCTKESWTVPGDQRISFTGGQAPLKSCVSCLRSV